MPIPSDYKEIIENLFVATDSGRARWESTKFGFEISVLESRFMIWSGVDEENGVAFVSFALTDERGKNLDTWYVDESDGDYELMHRLFSGAKRQALGISKILENLKSAIKSGEVIGGAKDDIPF